MASKLMLMVTIDIRSLDYEVQEQIYDEFYRLVYGMVYYIVQDHGAAEDIIQEAFLRAIGKRPQLLDESKIAGWLKTLTRNVTFSYLRKFKKNREVLDSESVLHNEAAVAMDSRTPLDLEVETKLMEQAMIRCINQLKPEYRRVLYMKSVQQLSYKEMAEEMGVTVGVIRQTLYRARELVKKRLMKDWGETE